MAVFYKWIKGCEVGSGLTSGLWTYLKWGSGTTGIDQMPTLHVNAGKNDTTQTTNLGYLLTNNMPSPRINNEWNFNAAINFMENGSTDLINGPLGKIHANNGWLNISSYSISGNVFTPLPIKIWSTNNSIAGTSYIGVQTTTDGKTVDEKWRIKITENTDGTTGNTTLPNGVIINGSVKIRTGQSTDMHNNLYVEGGMYLGTQFNADGTIKSNSVTATFPAFGDTSGAIAFHKSLNVYSSITSSGDISGSLLKATNYCEAPYFNATSDERAKENIELATYSALRLINQLPIYNYNYKSSPSERVTGILAQDLLAAQPAELDLVSNKEATGEDGDYMSIKTDKITFVLMKAIQELQEEIIKLKDEIQQLKN